MRICILCEDSLLEEVRLVSESNGIGYKVLHIPVSLSGELPATHWFCCLTTNSSKILSLKKLTIMEESGPKKFLEKHNLRVIRS